jgi:hypothetical protein
MLVAMYVIASLHRPPRCSVTNGGRVNQQAVDREVVMDIRRATTTGAALLALVVSATPAIANAVDQEGRDRRPERSARVQPNNGGNNARAETSGDRGSGRQTQRSSPVETRRDVAVPRTAPRVASNVRTDTRQSAPQQTGTRQNAPQQTGTRQNAPRQYDPRQVAPRQNDARQYTSRQYDARQYNARPYDNRRYDNRGYAHGGYAYGGYGYGGYGYRPYVSRPGLYFGLGISIFAGQPYGFRFDYGWAPSYAYRFPMRQGIGYGGMSFLIDPDDAAVYVDGQFIGIARDFNGQPVPLAAGMHRIELQAEGRDPVMFDVSVRPGQVIPYRGSLTWYR